MANFKFIDLFSGIGGFHLAMQKLGGTCVLASDIDEYAINVYKKNYGIDSARDINEIHNDEVPDHDVLCAGFPCQTFSKAGKQMGFDDPTKGTLFFQIKRILLAKQPKYIFLKMFVICYHTIIIIHGILLKRNWIRLDIISVLLL